LVVRNSLYLPAFSPVQRLGAPVKDTLAPFLLADFGQGRDPFLNQDTTLASAGAGFHYQIAPGVVSTLTAAVALKPGPDTHAGAWRLAPAGAG
jgi:hypothetical protein